MPIADIKDIFGSTSEIKKNNGVLVIKESDNDSNRNSLKKVTLNNLNGDDLACFKLDKYVPITKYFNSTNNKGVNKGVDSVLFYKSNNVLYVFFIELKSFTLKKKDVANKFFASTAFIHQICFLLKNIYDKDVLTTNASAIVFSLSNANKRLVKFGMRPDIPTYNNASYSNQKKSIQVLEIQKNNGDKFNIGIDTLIEKARHKQIKNWP